MTIQLFYLKENRYYKTNVGNKRIDPINKCVKFVNHHVYSKYVFMLLTDIPLYLVLYTFGTYLFFVFVYMDVILVFFCFYTPTHTAWCFDNNNLFVFPNVM